MVNSNRDFVSYATAKRLTRFREFIRGQFGTSVIDQVLRRDVCQKRAPFHGQATPDSSVDAIPGRRVFKELGPYRKLHELARVYTMVVRDMVRVQNRIKSFMRSRGVEVTGKAVYGSEGREAYVKALPAGTREAVTTLYALYDVDKEVRKRAGPLDHRQPAFPQAVELANQPKPALPSTGC